MKKILFGLILLSVIAMPGISQADGLVPCGGLIYDSDGNIAGEEPSCELCHIFQLINNIINWVLFVLIPIIAPIFIVIGGIYLLIARGDPGMFSQGKNVLTATVIGLIIVYTAYVLLSTMLSFLGVADWTGLGTWWQIDCPVL